MYGFPGLSAIPLPKRFALNKLVIRLLSGISHGAGLNANAFNGKSRSIITMTLFIYLYIKFEFTGSCAAMC